MCYRKRIFALILALSLLASLVLPAAAYREDDFSLITSGQSVTPRATDEECLLKFTPEADGWYAFWSTGNADPNGKLWNEEFENNKHGNTEDRNFIIKAYLSAGRTYYLRAGWDWDPGVSLELHLDALVKAEALELNVGLFSGYAGENCYLTHSFRPMLAIDEAVTWESSDESVATVDNFGYVELVAPGTAVITATSQSGLTATCDIETKSLEQLYPGDSRELSAEDGLAVFLFVPETTGWYLFYSTNATGDPNGAILDEDGDYINLNDDTAPQDLNFLVRASLLAGHTYYLQAETYRGSYTAHLQAAPAPTELLLPESRIKGYPDEKFGLQVNFLPENCYGEEITWTSSNEDVAVVSVYGMVRLVSQGTAIITATSESGLSAQCEVIVKGTEVLTCDVPVTMDGDNGPQWFSFTPETDGWYRFFSTGDGVDPYCTIYNEDKSWEICSSDDGNDVNFDARCQLEAGQTYQIYVDYYFGEGAVTVEMEQMVTATALHLSQSAITADLYHYGLLELSASPDNAISETVTWESSDWDVVEVYDGDLWYAGVGTATITVTSESGLTASCIVTVREPVTITQDQPVTCGTGDSVQTFAFTPESDGVYAFWSTGELDTYAYIYLDGYYYGDDDDSGDFDNFQVWAELEAGKTYYLTAASRFVVEPFTVEISTMKEPEELVLDQDRLLAYVGDYVYLGGYTLLPYPSFDREVTWTYSNPELIDTQWPGEIGCLAPGTVIITATTEDGLSDSIELTILPVPEDVDDYGRCGDSLLYTVTDGVLTVTGEGAMSNNWWYTSCHTVELPEGVTYIGNENFSNSALESITIPSTVTRIGTRAFAWSQLQEVRFLGSAPKLGAGVFEEITATIYYPGDDPTWTEEVMADYGGEITWIPYMEVSGPVVSGTVTTFSEGDTLLELYRNEVLLQTVTVSGKTGSYEFDALTTGSFTLVVRKEGHVTRSYTLDVDAAVVTQDVKLHLPGDVTGDGKINVVDASKVYAHVRETSPLTDEYALACADITGDGNVNVADTSRIYAKAKQ